MTIASTQVQGTPVVSVICPTFGRPERHAALYRCFDQQTSEVFGYQTAVENRELLVLDDSPTPSPFFTDLKDPRVSYHHDPRRLSIGKKRNALCEAARGRVIAHFDDDDLYAPHYLEHMLQPLDSEKSLVKLSTWRSLRECDGSRWFWDTLFVHPKQQHYRVQGIPQAPIARFTPSDLGRGLDMWRHQTLWGFGFSYVYRRTAWQEVEGFPDRNHGEDHNFILRLQCRAMQLGLVQDSEDNPVCTHTLHEQSSSWIFPQTRLDTP